MNAAKTAVLPADILAKKAATTPTELEEPEKEEVAPSGSPRSCTVKVDAARYRRLSLARVNTGMSGQDILSEALDLWLKKHKF